MLLSVKTTKYAKKYEEYASTLSAGNDGLPLKDDELVGVLSHQLDDELHEATGMVLAKVLDTQVYQLILDLDVVDTDLDLLHQLFREKIPQRNVLSAKTVGGCGRRAVPTCCRCTAARCRSSRRSPAPTSCWRKTPPSLLSELSPRALPPS